MYDIAVVGGGPAGLHAALKAALLYKTCILLDKGSEQARIYPAPRIDNIPGHPEGISGRRLIEEGYAHIESVQERMGRRFVDIHRDTEVVAVAREGRLQEEPPLYVLQHRAVADPDRQEAARARNIVLATGVVDRQPVPEDDGHAASLVPYASKGLADFCILCEGHFVEDQRVAVIGCGRSVATVAASLQKNFGARAVVVTCNGIHPEHPEDEPVIPEESRLFLAEREIPVIEKTIDDWFGLREQKLGLVFEDGTKEVFDRGWISMGWARVNAQLAVALGAATAEDGTVVTNENCEVLDDAGERIPGLFAVGDLRHSWKQVPIAMGEAETAVVQAFSTRL